MDKNIVSAFQRLEDKIGTLFDKVSIMEQYLERQLTEQEKSIVSSSESRGSKVENIPNLSDVADVLTDFKSLVEQGLHVAVDMENVNYSLDPSSVKELKEILKETNSAIPGSFAESLARGGIKLEYHPEVDDSEFILTVNKELTDRYDIKKPKKVDYIEEVIQKYSKETGEFTKEESALFFKDLREAKIKQIEWEDEQYASGRKKKKPRREETYEARYSKETAQLKKWLDVVKADPSWNEIGTEETPMMSLFRQEWNKDGLEQYRDLMASIRQFAGVAVDEKLHKTDSAITELVKQFGLVFYIKDERNLKNLELEISNLIKDKCEMIWNYAMLSVNQGLRDMMGNHRKKWTQNKKYFTEEHFFAEISRISQEMGLGMPEDVKKDLFESYRALERKTIGE